MLFNFILAHHWVRKARWNRTVLHHVLLNLPVLLRYVERISTAQGPVVLSLCPALDQFRRINLLLSEEFRHYYGYHFVLLLVGCFGTPFRQGANQSFVKTLLPIGDACR